MRLGIVDYGPCNLGSIQQALDSLQVEVSFSNRPRVLQSCAGFVLPGVGHYGVAMASLRASGLERLLEDEVLGSGKPILGICLGMQLMAEGSEESGDTGLGWLPASVRHLGRSRQNLLGSAHNSSPDIGWFSIQTLNNSAQWTESEPLSTRAYFCHSYGIVDLNIEGALASRCGKPAVLAAWQRQQLLGVQFHPEKSFGFGRRLMQCFVQDCAVRAGAVSF